MSIYLLATFSHFAHNALFIDQYPNFPSQISGTAVFGAWIGITSIGVVGYLLMQYGKQMIGLIVIAVYSVMGFSGLAHYTTTPLVAHSFIINFSIWLEATTGLMVLIIAVKLLVKQFRNGRYEVA